MIKISEVKVLLNWQFYKKNNVKEEGREEKIITNFKSHIIVEKFVKTVY